MDLVLSIIIPIYNEEKYLSRCLDSIINQIDDKIEILLVDDGSTDGSREICLEYQSRYRGIKYLYKGNGGIVSARNYGIEKALGRYITFIDADDWVNSQYIVGITKIISQNPDIDVICSRMTRINENYVEDVCPGNESRYFSRREAVDELFSWNYFRWELAGKAYRRELFNGVHVDESIIICEDLERNWGLFNRANMFCYDNSLQYLYYINPLSTTNAIVPERNTSWRVYLKILNDSIPKSDGIINVLLSRGVNSVWVTFRDLYTSDNEGYEEILCELENGAKQIVDLYEEKEIILPPNIERMRDMRRVIDDNIGKNMHMMREVINNGKDLVVYGTGGVLKYLLKAMKQNDLFVKKYLISNNSRQGELFLGRPIVSIKDYNYDNSEYIVIATNQKNQMEISELLKHMGIHDYCGVDVGNIFE